MQDCFLQLCLCIAFVTCLQSTMFPNQESFSPLLQLSYSSALKMASILQKLINPQYSGPPEPPRNKVTVVGVGQVGMACAVSILLRVRALLLSPLLRLPSSPLVSQDGLIPRILPDWHRITDLLVSDLAVIPWLSLLRCGDNDRYILSIIKATSTETFESVFSSSAEIGQRLSGRRHQVYPIYWLHSEKSLYLNTNTLPSATACTVADGSNR